MSNLSTRQSLINLKHVKGDLVEWAQQENHVYIGREHPLLKGISYDWGNPYRPDPKLSDTDGREKCVNEFREYITNNQVLMSRLHELQGKVLGCWCAPSRCHGEILLELLEELYYPNGSSVVNTPTAQCSRSKEG